MINLCFRYGLADTEMRVLRMICRLTKTRSENDMCSSSNETDTNVQNVTENGLQLYEEG